MNHRLITVLSVIMLVLTGGAFLYARTNGAAPSQSTADVHDHDDHDHAAEIAQTPPSRPAEADAGHEGEDEHDHGVEEIVEHDQEGEAEHVHEEHAGEGILHLSPEQREEFGIRLAEAGPGVVSKTIVLPGEVKLNADRVVHVVPRVPGIVRSVEKGVGQRVAAGEILAWLESAEMGTAKIDYLAKWTEAECCTMDLRRAEEIHDNTLALLKLLETQPTIEELRESNGQALGENLGKLLAAYADYVRAQADYERDRALAEKKIASSKDLQVAESELKKSEADYWATRESLAFQVRRDLLEARQTRRLHEIELKGARRRLIVLGLSADDIQRLEQAAVKQPAGEQVAECGDPNCKGCSRQSSEDASLEEIEDKLAWYPLRAPFEGMIIEKHIALGEKLDDATDAFVIADLSTVWIDFNVYQKDLANVVEGRSVMILDANGTSPVEGMVAYMSPVVDTSTRTALARVILQNEKGLWRPGLFVQVHIALNGEEAVVAVPKDAVQRLGAEAVVFVEEGEGVKAMPVILGRENTTHVEVLAGLTRGQRYVTHGAYDLKAQMLTSGLDPHAGHGH